ncbi:MAG: thioredoxin family protein [Cytophagales bacterium]|nr:thioredoxin family protein [Cytophagales bacterium]
MALTESNLIEIGRSAPQFMLPDTVTGKSLRLIDLKGDKGTVIMFICNHCPYVVHVNEELVRLADEYQKKGIRFVAISSNDAAEYPEDAPEKMKEKAQELGYPFPYLYDESQQVAKSYDAACTPDFYLFDGELNLFYHGRLDESRPGSGIAVTGRDMRKAMDTLLVGDTPLSPQMPSIGCSIKWK